MKTYKRNFMRLKKLLGYILIFNIYGLLTINLHADAIGLSNASLNGIYWSMGTETRLAKQQFASYDDTASPTESLWSGTFTFDGQGGCSYSDTINKSAYLSSGGIVVIDDSHDSDQCTYTLTSDGTLTIGGSTGTEVAKVSPDTNIISIINIELEAGVAYVDSIMLVKQSSGLSNASLNGTYWSMATETRLAKQELDSDNNTTSNTESLWSGTFTFDGQGGCSYSDTIDKNAYLSAVGIVVTDDSHDSGQCTYTLTSDGTLTIGGNTGTEVAKVSPDTNTISIVGIESEIDSLEGNVAYVYSANLVKQSPSFNVNAILTIIVNYILF